MEKVTLELRAAEGGEDSKLLIGDMAAVYLKAAKIKGFVIEAENWMEGLITIWISGKGVKKFFQNEIGCHRWQRVPPTERKGRVHTSTVTVALLESKEFQEVSINMDEIRIELTRGTGNGGQHKNTTNSCVVLTHIPTKIKVVRDGRNQHRNKEEAFAELKLRLNEVYKTGYVDEITDRRRNQIGNGNRGSEKKRTYTQKQDLVVDHVTGKTASLKQFMKGKLELMC